jgi:hypothetical protein
MPNPTGSSPPVSRGEEEDVSLALQALALSGVGIFAPPAQVPSDRSPSLALLRRAGLSRGFVVCFLPRPAVVMVSEEGLPPRRMQSGLGPMDLHVFTPHKTCPQSFRWGASLSRSRATYGSFRAIDF